jgi:hypothetical protein
VLVFVHAARGSKGAATPTRLEALLLGDQLGQVPANRSSPSDPSSAGVVVLRRSGWGTSPECVGAAQACEALLHAAAEVSDAENAALRAETRPCGRRMEPCMKRIRLCEL